MILIWISLSQVMMYSKTSELRTSRIRLPPSYDRFFIDGLFSLLCICKSCLWNTITSQTRHTMMKNGRNTIGHTFLSLEKSFFRVNYRKISRDGFIVTEFLAILSLVHHFELNLRHEWPDMNDFPWSRGNHLPWLLRRPLDAHSWQQLTRFDHLAFLNKNRIPRN